MSSRSYILQIMQWHQSLKSIQYRTLLIFQNKKTTDLRVETWGGYITPTPPPRIYALAPLHYQQNCYLHEHRIGKHVFELPNF